MSYFSQQSQLFLNMVLKAICFAFRVSEDTHSLWDLDARMLELEINCCYNSNYQRIRATGYEAHLSEAHADRV